MVSLIRTSKDRPAVIALQDPHVFSVRRIWSVSAQKRDESRTRNLRLMPPDGAGCFGSTKSVQSSSGKGEGGRERGRKLGSPFLERESRTACSSQRSRERRASFTWVIDVDPKNSFKTFRRIVLEWAQSSQRVERPCQRSVFHCFLGIPVVGTTQRCHLSAFSVGPSMAAELNHPRNELWWRPSVSLPSAHPAGELALRMKAARRDPDCCSILTYSISMVKGGFRGSLEPHFIFAR